jgi:hypothetical protein
MRRLRIAAPVQLPLTLSSGEVPRGLQLWSALPDAVREQVLVLLARLIARGVIVDDPREPSR